MDMKDDCVIEEVTPSKARKLKQARLTFQLSCSSKSLSDNVSSKKRKLESPEECKIPKMVKVTTKGNSIKDSEIDDKVLNESTTSCSSKTDIELIELTDEEEKSMHHNEGINNSVKSKRFIKTTKKESCLPNAPLTKFLTKRNKKHDKYISIDDNIKENAEQCDISPIQNSHENSDKDFNVADDDILKVKINDSETSHNTDIQQNNKLSCADSNSEMDVSSENEDNNVKESENKESISLDIKSLKTPTKTTENTEVMKNKKVTPKLLHKGESAKKRQEKEKLRMEKERRREEERENRRKEKEERRKEKEEKEKAEREQKKKEREQKELKKQMEMEQKQKEKEAKEQERRKKEEAKEEERKRKEEEKLESERKKQKAASNFASFFVPKKLEIKSTEEENNTNVQTFMPFEVKADMRIAPISRRSLNEKEMLSLDDKFNSGRAKNSDLYLAVMKAKKIITHNSEKTWPLEAKDDIVILDEEENGSKSSIIFQPKVVVDKNRPKLLQFHENRRPPYWGTWRKQSNNINPRRPFSKDSKWFDYEVDSDEEWEEEEPGESLHGSEDEKDEENPDDNEYDVDNEFMVPHGYLSDEEARTDEEEDESMTPETQKFKLKLLGEEFEAERRTKMSKLKPKIIGCVWLGPDNTYPENTPKRVVEFLTARHAWVSQIPVVLPSTMKENTDADSGTPSRTQTSGYTRKTKVPAEALADLIRLIHGNIHGKNFLIKEFLTFWNKKNVGIDSQISKASLGKKIGEIGKWMSCPDEGQMHLKACWYVSEEIRKKYLNEELTLPNRWTYNLTPKRKSEIPDSNDKVEKLEKDNDKDKKKVPLITQFTKKITQEEMKRQLSTDPKQIIKPTPILQRPPKRAVLISIPKNDKKEVPLLNIEECESKKLSDSKEK
ncbi:chromatin assembly factor 1 subunit A [Vespula pensylvanica]|uniref:chromatin assembly factor 1 subunit A n=1 Tax=Vespula pensylvanica TaxID=30213 RepID=UPI001CB9EFB9|nr:chromatin assembly factor 1 subunit A [Vespula pensylvanica]